MVSLVRAIISGFAATDSLPISGAAYLLGTMTAVLVYFGRDWLTVLRAGLSAVRTCSIQDPDACLRLVLGTIPAALAGLLLQAFFESTCSDPPVMLLLWAAMVGVSNSCLLSVCFGARFSGFSRNSACCRACYPFCALFRLLRLIRVFQVVPILPGLSRSGGTISAGVMRGAGLKQMSDTNGTLTIWSLVRLRRLDGFAGIRMVFGTLCLPVALLP